MNWTTLITSDSAILHGKPAIRGTRIGVDLILEKLAAGQTITQLLAAYPHLKEEQILACLAFAAEHIKLGVKFEQTKNTEKRILTSIERGAKEVKPRCLGVFLSTSSIKKRPRWREPAGAGSSHPLLPLKNAPRS